MRKLFVLAAVVLALAAPSLASACNDSRFKQVDTYSVEQVGLALEYFDYAPRSAKSTAFRAYQAMLKGAIPCKAKIRKYRTYRMQMALALYKAANAEVLGDNDLVVYHLEQASDWGDKALALGNVFAGVR